MLQSASDAKQRRFPNVVVSKVTDRQWRWLTDLAERQNKKLSEVLRDLVQGAMDAGTANGPASLLSEICNAQALLQCIRAELLTIGACLASGAAYDPQSLKARSEQVALADLAAFKTRILEQASFRRSLTKEAK